MKLIKINLGCGMDYREGWVNVDFNKEVKADVYADFTKKLPFKNNYADVVLLDNVIEHIPQERYFAFLEEIHRICKNGAKIYIYAPHYSGMYALKHPAHYKYFGIGSLDFLRPERAFNGERYSKARFKLQRERLLFFHHNLVNFPILSKLPINWLFNFGRVWQQLMERFQFLGFDEIYYELVAHK
jgi:SAM-dependent methyltransferase